MPRRLGVGIAMTTVVANMVGVGVFTTAGFQAADLVNPYAMILTWIIGGVLALCGAAVYAELATMIPNAGGDYVYLRTAFHPALGFASGWTSLTAGFSAPIAAAALAFGQYLVRVFPNTGVDARWIAVALIASFAFLHGYDTVLGGRVQAAFTIGKVVIIVGFVVAGLLFGNGSWSHFATQRVEHEEIHVQEFATSLMYVGFAYSGWNAATYVAGEVSNPKKTLPWALLGGTALVMLLYVSLNVVFLYAVPPYELAGVLEVGDLAARRLFGDATGRVLSMAIALALVSSVSSMVMVGPRVYAAMAEDRALPQFLSRRSTRGVPANAIVTQAAIAICLVALWSPDELIRYVGFGLALFSAFTVASVFVLRRRFGAPEGAYRTPGYPVTPVLFIALSGGTAIAQLSSAVCSRPRELVLTLGTFVVGALAFNLRRRH